MEVESASRTLVNIALREFRESEAHVNRPGATSYALGRCAEVGYMAAHHLHHGLQVVRVGWGHGGNLCAKFPVCSSAVPHLKNSLSAYRLKARLT